MIIGVYIFSIIISKQNHIKIILKKYEKKLAKPHKFCP